MLGNTVLNASEKTGTEHPEDPSSKFLKILNMGSTSLKNMNWKFGIEYGITISSKNMRWQFETKGP